MEKKNFSSILTTFKLQLDSQKHKIKNLESNLKENELNEIDNLNENDLRKEIEEQKIQQEKFENSESRIKNINIELLLCNSEIEKIKTENNFKTENEIENEIVECEENLKTTKLKLEECEINVEKIRKYEIFMNEKKNFDEWKDKVEKLRKDEIIQRNKYSACINLKEKILKAESIAISVIIENINSHAREYLDIFFVNEPLSAQLLPFKQSKKTNKESKPQINLEINYKEIETDVSMLSGGELSRVILAFTLAFAEIFNAPMILLDECTASLDQETTSVVMEGIKNNFNDKPVLVIAHQVVSGDFDTKVQLT